MTREDLRLKLQSLLNSFGKEHGLDAEEVHTIATTIITLMYSDRASRAIWYREIHKVATLISQNLKEQGEMILAGLDMSDEEKEKLKSMIKSMLTKDKKVEN